MQDLYFKNSRDTEDFQHEGLQPIVWCARGSIREQKKAQLVYEVIVKTFSFETMVLNYDHVFMSC